MSVRQDWSRDEEGWWWYRHFRSEGGGKQIKVKVTEGGEGKLFGCPDDKSQLQVADLLQYATHVQIKHDRSEHREQSLTKIVDWMTKVEEVLQTADDPVPSLEALDIEHQHEWWPFFGFDAIKSRKLTKLKHLRLKNLSRHYREEEYKLLLSAIDAGCLRSMRHLTLEHYIFTIEHVGLAKAMESCQLLALETLELLYTGIGDAGCEAYANAIIGGKLPSLKSLALSGYAGNKIGIRGIAALGQAIESGELKNLTELNLSGNHLGTREGHFILAEHMGSGRIQKLERLNLSYTAMGGEACKAYTKAIISGQLPSLSCIWFGHNQIGDKGAESLGLAIRCGGLKSLAELDLGYNKITDEGITSLASSVKQGEADILLNLRSLDLFDNFITDAGLQSIAEALKSGRLNSLEKIDLYARNISKKGVSALVSALSDNMLLTVDVQSLEINFPKLTRRLYQLRQRNLRRKAISEGLVDSPVVPATFGKVYLCGNPNAGKTTLCRTLQMSLFESLRMWKTRSRTEERTRGIDVSLLSSHSRKQDDNTTTLLVWDMAGQEDYHVLHNAFFPDLSYAEGKATSFVIVCGSKILESKKTVHQSKEYGKDSKQQVEHWMHQLRYWLQFIASSCGKSTDRRHVLVVLNNFDGELNIPRYLQAWEQGLKILKQYFEDYLEIRTDPFILDVRKYQSVQLFKGRLLQHAKSLLKDKRIPAICQYIQQNLSHWGEQRKEFPVLRWGDFVHKVVQSSNEPWPMETLEAAAKYLNESGVLIYIDREVSSEQLAQYQKLIVLNPSWLCREIVGNMFLREDMGLPTDFLFRAKVDKLTGSISESEFKKFFTKLLDTQNEWSDEDLGDLLAILLWLGLCYKGGEQRLFIPSLIAENNTTWDHWEAGNSLRRYGEDQWVMGFSIEHSKSKVTIAPIALWHRFQVELAQNQKLNGHPDNDFFTGKYFASFCVDFMSVLIEVNVGKGRPTFNNISIFVKPLRKEEDFDGNQRKQYQVDLASDLVEILLGLWIHVCPGVGYVHRVIWPWPASQSRQQAVSERDVEVEQVKKWVQEHGLGRSMQWMVGSNGMIKEDQLLATKDKMDEVRKYQALVQDTLSMLKQFEREAVDEGIYPANVLTEEVPCQVSNMALDGTEIRGLPTSSSGKMLLRKLESMEKKIVKQLDNMEGKLDSIEGLIREGFKAVRKKEKELLDKLQDTGDFILQDRERICPRFFYLGERDSGAWMTLKDALSLWERTRLHFLCEARFNDYGQHAVKNQEGLDLSHFKDWAKKIIPWLKVSLAVMFISAKVAANIVLPGVGLVLPDFTQWQQASSLSDAIALATAFSTDELNKQIKDGAELNANPAQQNRRVLNGKSRKALSDFLEKLTPDEYERKLGLRKVDLSYTDGGHGVVWICNECFQKYDSSPSSVTELPI